MWSRAWPRWAGSALRRRSRGSRIDRVRTRFATPVFSLLICAIPVSAAVSGEAVYQKRCSGCHDSGGERTPTRDALKQLSVSRILRTLNFGVMINVAYPLSNEEREAVAKYLGVDRSVSFREPARASWPGWGPEPANTRYTKDGGITLAQVPKLKLKWAYAFEGDVSAFGAPTVI